MRCSKCGWEGEESELIEKPSELRPNDHLNSAIFIMATTRSVFTCPVCGTPLEEKKFMYGGEVESRVL
jgi:predicted RNA-binding Zn-ribbon protein involved in translation (DUF1610 family)